MGVGENIKKKRLEAGLTLEDVAKIVGVSRQTLSRYETGVIGNIPSDKIEAIAKAIHTTPAVIMGWEDTAKTLPINIVPLGEMKKIPLVGSIACGQPILAEEHITDYIDLPTHIRADYALTCRGDSMINAGINDGDIVYIRKQETVENGQIAAVIVGEDETEATLKRFYFANGIVTLNAENAAFSPIVIMGADLEHVRVIGLAIAFTHVIK